MLSFFVSPPANDHLSLSTELFFVPIITIDKVWFLLNSTAMKRMKRYFKTIASKAQVEHKNVSTFTTRFIL